MQTLPIPTLPCKPEPRTSSRAFHAHYYDQPGILRLIAGELVFIGDDDSITTIEPPDINFLCVLGDVELSSKQYVSDQIAFAFNH